MKRKHITLLITVILVLAVGAVVELYIHSGAAPGTVTADLYFMNEDGTGIVSEQHEMRYRDNDEMARSIIDRLRKGPASSKLGRIMPRDTKLRSIGFSDDGSAVVDFSQSFLTDDASKNVLSVYAVTKSLCSAGIVSSVLVTVNGNGITNRDGNLLGYIAASDINLETEEYQSEMRSVTLYFSSRSDGKLVKEERTIKITDQQPIEQYIINELIKGPSDKRLQAVLSRHTVLISVDVEDNICYLNFKSSFLKDNSGGSVHENQVIYSIVNSLTELQTIGRVQFYMDGRRIDKFGDFDMKGYISRNTGIISD